MRPANRARHNGGEQNHQADDFLVLQRRCLPRHRQHGNGLDEHERQNKTKRRFDADHHKLVPAQRIAMTTPNNRTSKEDIKTSSGA